MAKAEQLNLMIHGDLMKIHIYQHERNKGNSKYPQVEMEKVVS